MTARYPVTLDVEGRLCAVLGGDGVALDKVRALLEAGARVVLIAEQAVAGLEELEAGGRLEWRRRAPEPTDLEGVWLAIDASGDEQVNRDSWAAAERHGVLLNVVDRPQRCHFAAPAVVRRGPLRVAISTSGESPFLASALRARLERVIGTEWGAFAELVGRVRRRLKREGVPSGRQLDIYRRLIRSDVRRLLRDRRTEAAEFEAAAIVGGEPDAAPGGVTLVGAGPGDPGLLTVAGAERLAGADVVFHDALVGSEILALCSEHARLVDVGKRGGRPSPDQQTVSAAMVEAARAGQEVVRLKGGDPFIFGRGGEEVAALNQAGIPVTVIPGVSSAAAAPALAGIPLTLRGVASSVAFATARAGSEGGGPERLLALAAAVDTLVVLMPLAGLEELAGHLSSVLGKERPAALICCASQPGELVIRGTLGTLADAARRGGAVAPATLVVGQVVAAAASLGTDSASPPGSSQATA